MCNYHGLTISWLGKDMGANRSSDPRNTTQWWSTDVNLLIQSVVHWTPPLEGVMDIRWDAIKVITCGLYVVILLHTCIHTYIPAYIIFYYRSHTHIFMRRHLTFTWSSESAMLGTNFLHIHAYSDMNACKQWGTRLVCNFRRSVTTTSGCYWSTKIMCSRAAPMRSPHDAQGGR